MQKRKPLFIVIFLLILLVGVFVRKNRRSNVKRLDETARLIYTKHARCRMECRHIDESEVREILEKGTLNESKSEPNDKPDPKFAYEGTTHDGQSVRIVFAPTKNGTVVITVIDLGREWQCNCN